MHMKKNFFLRTAAACLAAVLLYPVNVEAISAKNAILMDGNTGRILYEKRANEKSLVASCTKIMTALVVCEQCNVLDRVRIPKEAVGVEGSSMYLQPGEVLTVQELLYGLMLHSGNDAALALAIYCGGTVEGFAEMMNDKARLLELSCTHFTNPHGLDAPDHYSSARDLAVLASYAMKNPIFAKTVSTKQVTIGNRYLTNHNKLLWQCDGADGVKTGYTKAAGRILVSSAVRQGRRLVCVTVDDGNDWQDHKTLYDQYFPVFQLQTVIRAGDVAGKLPVFGGTEGYVELIAAEDLTFALASEEKASIHLQTKAFVYAPVVENGKAGWAYLLVDGEPVGRVALVYGKTVEQTLPEKRSFWQRIFGGDEQ